MERKITVDSITQLNHNVVHLVTKKPKNYNYIPGQATKLALTKPGWKDEKRSFTFTSLPKSDALEFLIKSYPDHDGVTIQMPALEPGDELLLGEVWGAIEYKGPGVFIAGGAGVTPFIAILKDLAEQNKIQGNTLLFANKKERDIFYKDHFENWLGDNFINILSKEKTKAYAYGRIDKDFLSEQIADFGCYFYVCGPPEMSEDIIGFLQELGADRKKIVAENFN